jgi:hypothetical protein
MRFHRILICLAASLALEAAPLHAQLRLPSAGIVKGYGSVYGVSGRQRVPRGKKLVLQQGVRIVGVGPNAVLEVEGSLVVHGMPTARIVFEGLTIEPVGDFDKIQLEWTEFEGGAGVASGIATAPGKSARGDLALTNSRFLGSAGVDVELRGGSVRMEQFEVDSWVRIEGVPAKPEDPGDDSKPRKAFSAPVELLTGDCRFRDGLKLKALREGVVRGSLLVGPSSEFFGCKELQLTDNRIESKVLVLGHEDARILEKSKVTRCDIYASEIRLDAPAGSGKPRRLTLDACWFSAGVTEEAVAEITTDHEDEPTIGVVARITNQRDEPRFR